MDITKMTDAQLADWIANLRSKPRPTTLEKQYLQEAVLEQERRIRSTEITSD